MEWIEQIKAALHWLPKDPDTIFDGWGIAVVTAFVAFVGFVASKLRKPKDSSGQHDTDDSSAKERQELIGRFQWELGELDTRLHPKERSLDLDKTLARNEVTSHDFRQESLDRTLLRDGVEVETTDQPIVDLFHRPDVGQRLAILGKPGSGKTACLLKLLKHLLEEAKTAETVEKTAPSLPVIFECSEWDGRELMPWMASQLRRRYQIPEKTALRMLEERGILPLFDGLDELAADRQGDFVHFFNALPADRPQVVCCRVKEYDHLLENSGEKLALSNAVILQDISRKKLEGHLRRKGQDELWHLLERSESEADPPSSAPAEEGRETDQPQTLMQLAQRPLFLGLMTDLDKRLRKGWRRRKDETWEESLWRLYLEGCLGKRQPKPKQPPDAYDKKYARDKSLHWLRCLAGWMRAEDKVELRIEELQPSMLRHYWRFGLCYGLFYGLAWGLAIGLFTWPVLGAALALSMGMLVGLPGSFALKENLNIPIALSWSMVGVLAGQPIFGLVVGLFFMMTTRDEQLKIHPFRPARLPASEQDGKTFIRHLLIGLLFELAIGLFCGLIIGLVQARGVGLESWLAVMFALWMNIGLLVGLAAGLRAVAGPLSKTTKPQQRLNDALHSSLIFFPLFTLTGMTAFVQVLLLAEHWEIAVGLFFNMQIFYMVLFGTAILSFFFLGTNQVLQHYLLRLCLRLEGQLPLRLVPWLGAVHQRKVLQRVGGSYRFLHKQLRDYLAKQHLHQTE